ncbi:MAG: hypothetical protein JWO86_6724 [Myxococcaceae bacterium]|nr:hypothetical protein [Myxococcaceae bacterium]
MSRHAARWVGLVALATIVLACNSILGLTDFVVTPDPADATDEQTVTGDGGTCPDSGISDADLAAVCYPCNPLITEQLLNACTGAQCVPFDRARLTKLLPDGGLPGLPPDPDGG